MDILKNYEALISRAEDEFERELILESMQAFPKYVTAVYNMTITLPIIQLRYNGEEYRDRVVALDRARKEAHDCAINSATILNRMCTAYDVDCFCPETEDRYVIGNFCALISVKIFKKGTNASSLDELINELAAERGGEK